MYGNIYNTDEEQIGTIVMLSKNKLMIGRISNMEENKAPIVGFIINYDEDNFIGRLMSLFGPAPHMWGKYIPN
jgi:rRNA processing protein Gar1